MGKKIAREQAMPRYPALVASASMPVAAQVSLTGVRNPLASYNRVVSPPAITWRVSKGITSNIIGRTRGPAKTAVGVLDRSFLGARIMAQQIRTTGSENMHQKTFERQASGTARRFVLNEDLRVENSADPLDEIKSALDREMTMNQLDAPSVIT